MLTWVFHQNAPKNPSLLRSAGHCSGSGFMGCSTEAKPVRSTIYNTPETSHREGLEAKLSSPKPQTHLLN